MSTFVVAFLVMALGLALWRIAAQRRFIRQLSEAIGNGQALLRSKEGGIYRRGSWNNFRLQVNALIDELKQVRSDRATQVGQLQATLESIREAVLILDGDNRIVLANDAFRALFPAGEEIAGQRVEAVFQSSAFFEYVRETREAGGGEQREIEFRTREGSVWAEATCSAVPAFGEDAGGSMLFVLHNITRLKQLETMRKEFVANVSHELRTPLSMIKGYVETLVDGGNEVGEKDRYKFLNTIHKHTNRLNALLEDLLTISRLESRREVLSGENLDLGSLISEVAENYRESGLLDGTRLSVDLPSGGVEVFGDGTRLRQVFENLIDNAIKYSPEEPRIEIGAGAEAELIKVWVKDQGVGLSSKDLPRVFERFYRVDKGRSREQGGTGLGLSIVKHIVQLHCGTVWAESRLGEGTTFFFTLPVASDDSPDDTVTQSDVSGANGG